MEARRESVGLFFCLKVRTEKLVRGIKGTSDTIAKMHKLVAIGKLDPTIQKIATWIRLQVPQDYRGSSRATVDAVFRWLKRHQVFQRDPFQIEKIEHPLESMRPVIEARTMGAYRGRGLVVGDCDTLSAVYLASLLGALGFNYAFETVKVDKGRPDEFSHVYLAVRIGNEWYPLDPSTRGFAPGERPPVPPDRIKRWPEKPIEETMGLSGCCPRGNGLGTDQKTRMKQDDWPDVPLDEEWLSSEQYNYGIPKYLGDRHGKPKIPHTTGGVFEPLVSVQPMESRGDMEFRAKMVKKIRRGQTTPVGRVSMEVHQRPAYVGKRPYVRVTQQGNPWYWGENKVLQELYDKKKPYVHQWKQRRPVFRRSDAVVLDPVAVRGRKIGRRRKTEVTFMRPETPSAGLSGGSMRSNGFGQFPTVTVDVDPVEEALKKAVAEGEAEKARYEAEKAATSVWGNISDAISNLAPTIGNVAAKAIEGKYAVKVAKATQGATGLTVSPPALAATRPVQTARRAPTPFWKSPWLWVGGALAVGGIAFVALKAKRRPTRRRRTRRNVMRYRRRVA